MEFLRIRGIACNEVSSFYFLGKTIYNTEGSVFLVQKGFGSESVQIGSDFFAHVPVWRTVAVGKQLCKDSAVTGKCRLAKPVPGQIRSVQVGACNAIS